MREHCVVVRNWYRMVKLLKPCIYIFFFKLIGKATSDPRVSMRITSK